MTARTMNLSAIRHIGAQSCACCGKLLPFSSFEWQKNRPNPRKTCKKCRYENRDMEKERVVRRERQKIWYRNNVAKANLWREKNVDRLKDWNLRKTYGININQYVSMLDSQDRKCAICATPFSDLTQKQVHVDHCHETSRVRGILCSACNLMLGKARDNVDILKSAIEYLTKPHYELGE